MIPPLFAICKESAPVKALLGAGTELDPLRVFAFDDAGDDVATPHVTWNIISGSPNNYLGDLPDRDHYSLQIDVWANGTDQAEAVAIALRNAIEKFGYINAYRGLSRDAETSLYRISFDAYLGVDR